MLNKLVNAIWVLPLSPISSVICYLVVCLWVYPCKQAPGTKGEVMVFFGCRTTGGKPMRNVHLFSTSSKFIQVKEGEGRRVSSDAPQTQQSCCNCLAGMTVSIGLQLGSRSHSTCRAGSCCSGHEHISCKSCHQVVGRDPEIVHIYVTQYRCQ